MKSRSDATRVSEWKYPIQLYSRNNKLLTHNLLFCENVRKEGFNDSVSVVGWSGGSGVGVGGDIVMSIQYRILN